MRTTLFRGGIAIAVLAVLTTAPALAQSLIRGSVKDAKDQPVEGAVIVFEAQNVPAKREVKTDRKGEYIFMGLASGPYKVTASKDGVGEETHMVTIQQTKMSLNFTLTPAAPTASAGVESLAAAADAGAEKAARDKEAAAVQTLASSAMEAYKSERYEEAIPQLTELATKIPACADCYMYLGNSYAALKRNDEAEAALKKSVETRPTVEGYTALTRFYNQQRKFDLAAEASKKASELAAAPAPLAAGAPGAAPGAAAPAPSANSETLYNQGVVLWNAGKYAEAKEQFEAAVKANPGNADAQYQLGMANLNLGQMGPAREAFDAYLKAAPDGTRAAEVKAMLAQLPK
jgi:tetratricopeptide (TPR) repeat protein